jgi:ABC-type multidrug transport system fused ATPase/permease subunit
LLNAPISFFERNPIGRILSRFSNDVMSVDTEVSVISHEVLTLFVQVLSTMIIIVYSSYWFVIPLIPICKEPLLIIQKLFSTSWSKDCLGILSGT